MLEAALERRCVNLAKQAGCILLKVQGTKGYPDRICLCPGGKVFFIEFKREGGELAPLQRFHLSKLRSMGFVAESVDNVNLFLRLLNERLR